MVMKKFLSMFGAGAVAVAVTLSGCGKSQEAGKVDLNKPVEQVKTEAASLDTAALQQQVDAYQKEITAKKGELAALEKKIKDIPVTQLLGEEASKLKKEAGNLTTALSGLSDRLNVYSAELKKKAATVK
jgi:predicted  nucleic acid-binding Zn-ribbon protein